MIAAGVVCGAAVPRSALRHRMAVVVAASLVGLLCDAVGGAAPLAFAAGMILVVGLPHGASDHLVVLGGAPARGRAARLALFLAVYVAVVAATLLAWSAAPGATLLGFLVLSAIHFGIDDVPAGSPASRLWERIARGLMPITLPALLHADGLAGLFAALSTDEAGRALAQLALHLAPVALGLVAAAIGIRLAARDGDTVAELAAMTAALVLFSPLVGFALVFALVHGRGQVRERMRDLALPGLTRYLVACGPTLAGAAILFATLAVLEFHGRAPALGPLFVGLSALTVPHMLVTPLFKPGRTRS